MNSNFIDYVKIYCRSGKGGAGSTHLRREKFIPKGGPDGGDGGRGGHVIVRGNSQLWTLLHLRYTKHVIAESGTSGSKQQRTGAFGKDAYIEVPLGTVIKNAETNEELAEITLHGQEAILLNGGRGGQGNTHFKTSTRQTPRFAQPGEPGLEMHMIFELKVLADVGLVGFPNAGKSTLLSVVSAARPEIGAYPFTTLVPNLGIVSYYDQQSFVMADIPGIIEGAHEGKGLGHRFLRHIERNAVLLLMIPSNSENIKKEFTILVNELQQYNPELLDKKKVLAVTKCDLLDDVSLARLEKKVRKAIPEVPLAMISSHTGYGIQQLKDLLWTAMNENPDGNA